MEAELLTARQGFLAKDGAGVKLVRVLSRRSMKEYDPFLMLDSFDSRNYDDYKAGFPMHPHRGIETITYLSQGHVTHRDSMGNEKKIGPGSIQWMTAGSGILHSEFFDEEDRLLGLQLWLNMPASDKMKRPEYRELHREDVPVVEKNNMKIFVYAGELEGEKGYQSKYQPLDYFVLHMEEGAEITVPGKDGYQHVLFTLTGEAKTDGKVIPEKTAARYSDGDLTITAISDGEFVYLSSPPLNEPVAWGGPVVMNTDRELQQTFIELEQGTFIKEEIE